MKNFTICFVVFISCIFFEPALAGTPLQEQKINTTIEQYLQEAEKSIKKMDFDKAAKQLNKAMKLAKEIDHQKYIALSSGILGQLYYVRYDMEKAKTELLRAISIQRQIEDDAGLAHSYVNFAKIFIFNHNYPRATTYLYLAEELYTEQENIEALGVVALNRGILALNTTGKYEKAREYFQEAELKLEQSRNNYERSRLYYYKGRINLVLGNMDKALQETQTSLDIARKYEFGGMLKSGTYLLSQIYEADKNFEQSLFYLKEGNKIRDSLFNLSREALILEANARYGLDALNSEIRKLTRINAKQVQTLKISKLTTILSVALISILTLLTLYMYKNNALRSRANELLLKKNKKLISEKEVAEQASAAKAQFLSTITHELRTPLYAVTGLTHLLLEEDPAPNQKEHLNSLKFSGEYLLSLINNILDLNKLEAQKVEMFETSFNLQKRISDVLTNLKKSAQDKNTSLHLDFDENLPKKLKGDPLKISQILINLIGNSIKFTESGEVRVRVKKLEQEGSILLLKFEVEDTGEGIGEEKQQHIFENFTQGSLQINRKFGGTGLGLSIVKNLLTLMNSEIHLTSELGKGSCFYFELNFEAVVPSKEIKEKSSQAKVFYDQMTQKKILVVEDNKINQMITRKILEKHEVICDVADNGHDAIEKAKNNKFDLILMDIHMPGISGIEAASEIRKFNKQVPIIALTAVTLEDDLAEFYENGFDDIIPKPYKIEEFFNKITKQFSKEMETT